MFASRQTKTMESSPLRKSYNSPSADMGIIMMEQRTFQRKQNISRKILGTITNPFEGMHLLYLSLWNVYSTSIPLNWVNPTVGATEIYPKFNTDFFRKPYLEGACKILVSWGPHGIITSIGKLKSIQNKLQIFLENYV